MKTEISIEFVKNYYRFEKESFIGGREDYSAITGTGS